MKAIFLFILFSLYILPFKDVEPALGGQYAFRIKGEMYSSYYFGKENYFSSFLSGDMGTFYGEGKYRLEGSWLILKYDSTGVAGRANDMFSNKENEKVHITPTGVDTLEISNLKERRFDLNCAYTGRIETYRRIKPYKSEK